MKKIKLPSDWNYVGVFLTLSCNLSCDYCINTLSGGLVKKKLISHDEWINALNRIELPENLPLTLQGGEPTIHPGFYQIVNGLNADIPIDLLTNAQFDPIKFSSLISPSRLKRDAKYASIRVSYHPTTMNWAQTLEKVLWLQDKGYSISLNSVFHPETEKHLLECQQAALSKGIDFRFKEFLGVYNNKIYGTYKYADACFSDNLKTVSCKTSELLIAPDAQVYRCHHDLYNSYKPTGSLLSEDFSIDAGFSRCEKYGKCNPCDVKVKNNRLQEWGHTSVEINF